jgi:protein-tyrosine phosphatase
VWLTDERFRDVIRRVLADLSAGPGVAVHRHAGRGRTGTLAACVAREALGLSGDAAITWVRTCVPGAIESRAQEEPIRRLDPG